MDSTGGTGTVLFAGGTFDVEAIRARRAGVDVVSTVAAAAARVRDGGVAAVVGAARLDDGTGVDLVRAVRECSPAPPVVLWPAEGDEALASDAVAAGVSRYVVRDGPPTPESVDGVLETVARVRGRETDPADGDASPLVDRLLAASPSGIAVVGPDGRIVRANERVEDILGVSEDAMVGRHANDADWGLVDRHGDPVPDANLPVVETLATGDPVRGREFGITRPGGERRWVLVTTAPLDRAAGAAAGGAVVTVEDVTELRRTRDSLRRERDRTRTYLDAAGMAMVALDDEGTVTMANRRTRDLLGADEGEVVGRDWFESFVPADCREATRETFEELLSGDVDGEERFDNPVRTVDGERRMVEWHNAVRRDETGDPMGTLSAGHDVTERRRRERELELFRDLLDHASDAITVVDPSTGGFLDVNETACRMLGYERSDLLSLTVPDVDPQMTAASWREFAATVAPGERRVVHRTNRRADGSTFPVEVTVSRVSLDREYLVAAVRDVSDLRARERERRASEERYRSLVEAAPDPIFVADAESGEIVETNAAACRIRNQSREEVVGTHQSDLHPPDETARYRTLFQRHVDQEGTISHFPDGSRVYLQSADGDRVPVAISVSTVEVDGRTLIHGIFRDVSDRVAYEESLRELNRAARRFLEAETDVGIASTAVEIADSALDPSLVAVYLYDDERGHLVPVATGADDGLVGAAPPVEPGASPVWRAYADGEQVALDDVDPVFGPRSPIASGLAVPLGDHGVVLAAGTDPGTFDGPTAELLEALVATAESALDRVEWARELELRRRESRRRARRLERESRVNERIRAIVRAVVDAESRAEMTRAACEELADLEPFAFTWVGEPDYVADALTPEAWAGTDADYLDGATLALDDAAEPAVRTARTHEPTAVGNVASEVRSEPWRQAALRRDFRSAIAVPLSHGELLYGVLAVYGSEPEAFDDRATSLLSELGELVGYAIHAVEGRSAASDGDAVALTFRVGARADPLVELATRADADLEVVSAGSRPDGSDLAQVRTTAADADRLREAAADVLAVETVRRPGESDPSTVECVVRGSTITDAVADLVATSAGVSVDDAAPRLTLTAPTGQSPRSLVEWVRERFADATFVTRQTVARDPTPRPGAALDALTDRQREVLRTAYYGGFFEQPRDRTGSELADALGISQPAFSKQIRKSQRALLEPLFGGR